MQLSKSHNIINCLTCNLSGNFDGLVRRPTSTKSAAIQVDEDIDLVVDLDVDFDLDVLVLVT
jgi:hypothetical protein